MLRREADMLQHPVRSVVRGGIGADGTRREVDEADDREVNGTRKSVRSTRHTRALHGPSARATLLSLA
jgi:hypothetical protein